MMTSSNRPRSLVATTTLVVSTALVLAGLLTSKEGVLLVEASKSGKQQLQHNVISSYGPWEYWNAPPPPPHDYWYGGSGGSDGSNHSSKGSKSSGSHEEGSVDSWAVPPSDYWHHGSSPPSKSSKGSKSSKSGSDNVVGQWVWVEDDDGWSSWSGGGGKSGKSDSSSYGGHEEESHNDDDGKWTDDGWNDDGHGDDDDGHHATAHATNDHEAPPTGWNSDGWDNDGHYKADIEYVRAEITQLIVDSYRTLIPEFLRLLFHDCVGGCDGCIDLTNTENNGLEGPMTEILPLVEKFKGFTGGYLDHGRAR